MLKKAVNLLRGTVTVRVQSPCPERVLNLCSGWNIDFWDLCWQNAEAFTVSLHRQDYPLLHQVCGKVEAEFCICRRKGMPYLLGHLRRRGGLLAGFSLGLLLLVFTSFFIWDIEIEGNQTVPEQTILRALAQQGVRQGRFAYGIDSEQLRNRILLQIPQLNWLVVNVKGCRAYVQVRERVPVPAIWSKLESANLVAAKSGLVTRVRALDGGAAVLPGQTVLPGELLISGVRSGAVYGTSFMSGLGEVRARTWYELSVKIPLYGQQKVYTGKTRNRYGISWGHRRINFYTNSSIDSLSYDKISQRCQWTLPGGLVLPITSIKEQLMFYECQHVLRPVEQVRVWAEQTLLDYLQSLLTEGIVSRTRFAQAEQDGCLLVSLSAECEESIGILRAIPQQNKGEEAWNKESAWNEWNRQ